MAPTSYEAGVDPVLTGAGVERTGATYLARQDPRQPLLSPAVVADLTGFSPMLLQVGTKDIMLDDSTRLAARANAAGVDVILDITADVPHVFQSFAGGPLDEADQALDRAALFISYHIARHGDRASAGQLTGDSRTRHRTGLNRRTSSGHHP
jgi:acetyl esterase/lipase